MITSERLVELVVEADSIVHRGANPESRSDFAAAVFNVLVDQEPERAAQAERDATQARIDAMHRGMQNEHRPGRAL